MKRLIVVFLIAVLVSGCNRTTDNVSPAPQSLNASALVPQSQNGTESSQFSPISAESVEPLKTQNTHENERWYIKYRPHVFVAVSLTFIAILSYFGYKQRESSKMWKRKFEETQKEQQKLAGLKRDNAAMMDVLNDVISDYVTESEEKQRCAGLAAEYQDKFSLLAKVQTVKGAEAVANRAYVAESKVEDMSNTINNLKMEIVNLNNLVETQKKQLEEKSVSV